MPIYSIEVDRYNPLALAHCLERLGNGIPDFEWDYHMTINAGGIDYGTYININLEDKTIEICNQPEYGTDGNNTIDEVIENFED